MNTDNITINTQSSIRIAGSSILYFDPLNIEDENHDANVVFITHAHFDHFSPNDIRKIVNEETKLYVPLSMKKEVEEKAGFVNDIIYVRPDSPMDTVLMRNSSVTVEPVRAYNVGKQFHPKENDWLGYIVTMDGVCYYIAGDTDANEDNLKVKCDVALIPVGGKYTFDAVEAADFVNKIRPRAAIPTHYGSIVGGAEAGAKFAAAVEDGIETYVTLSDCPVQLSKTIELK